LGSLPLSETTSRRHMGSLGPCTNYFSLRLLLLTLRSLDSTVSIAVGQCLPLVLSEVRNGSGLQNIVCSECQMIDKEHHPDNTQCYTQSSPVRTGLSVPLLSSRHWRSFRNHVIIKGIYVITKMKYEIWGFCHSCYQDCCVVGCLTIQLHKMVPVFLRNLLPSSYAPKEAAGPAKLLVPIYRTAWCHIQTALIFTVMLPAFFRPQDESGIFFWNVCNGLSNLMVSHIWEVRSHKELDSLFWK
jgi:hypothetical protein